MYPADFFPKEAGRDYAITPLLGPLEKHRNDFNVFSHLDHDIKGGHFSVHSFLSGVKMGDAKGPKGLRWLALSIVAEMKGGQDGVDTNVVEGVEKGVKKVRVQVGCPGFRCELLLSV